MKCFKFVVMAFALALCAPAMADLDGAKKALETVKKNIADDNTAGIDSDVKVVELELKDVPDADKKAIQDELDGIKKKLLETKSAKLKPGYMQSIESYVENAKRDMAENRPQSAVEWADRLDEYLTHDEVQELFSKDEIAQYKQRIDKYRKMGQAAMADANIDILTKSLGELEKEYADKMKEMKTENEGQARMTANSIAGDLQTFEGKLKDLPADNAKVKDMKTRLAKMQSDFQSAAMADLIKNKLAQLQNNWKSYETEYTGWEAEKPDVTFERYSKEGSTSMSAFMLPQTRNLISRASYQLDGLNSDEEYKQVANDPGIKAFVDNLTKQRDAAKEKMLKAATTLVEGAEKAKIDRNEVSSLSSLKNALESNLGKDAPQVPALQARVQKLADNYESSVAANEKAKADAYEQLVKDADAKWPAIAARYSSAKEIDPASPPAKGTLIVLKHRANRANWEFGHNDYQFVTAVNGVPVAGRYDASLQPVIDDMESRTGKSISDEYYDLIGEMQSTCRVQESQYSQILEKWVPTVVHNDAPLIRIVALHAGPVAAAAGDTPMASAGVAGASGASAGASGSGAGGWFLRLIYVLVGLVAAAVCLLKAGYAPVASLPQAGEIQAKLGGDNLAYIGLACAAWGVLWLLVGRIIYGLIPNLAIIAAGLYAALDFLAAKGIVKPDQLAKIKPLGVMIGLGCAALVVLELFIGGRLVIL